MMKRAIKFHTYVNHRLRGVFMSAMIAFFMLFSLGSTIYFGLLGQTRNMLLGLLCVFLTIPIMFGVEYIFKITIPNGFLCMLMVLLVGGIFLGPCYDLYSTLPWWDDVLHTLSGVIFACLGFALTKQCVKDDDKKKSYFVCLVGGVVFSLAIATVWEMFEYLGTQCGFDMQEDSIVYSFNSYLLSGSHNEIVTIDGITKTIIYFGEGQQLVIDGYLDLGLIDTLNDMLVCMIGTIVFFLAFAINYACKGKLDKVFIPSSTSIGYFECEEYQSALDDVDIAIAN